MSVTLSQETIDRIRSSRFRQRTLEIPVKHGKFGELKRCPLREGGVYTLVARIPYDEYCQQAQREPTRARAVLALIGRCEEKPRTVTITVLAPPARDGETWRVSFEKGDQSDQLDRDVFLSRHNDFTMAASRQTVKGDPPYLAPLAEDLKRARQKAKEARVTPQLANTRQMISTVGDLQRSMASMKTRNLAKRAERTLRALEVALREEAMLDSQALAATIGTAGEADRLPSASTSASPDATTPLEPAA